MNISAMHSQRLQNTITTVACLLALLFLYTPEAAGQGWLRHYPHPDNDDQHNHWMQLLAAENGDFLVAGWGYTPNIFQQQHFYVNRHSPDGALLWRRIIPMAGNASLNSSNVSFLEKCPGGGYVLGGRIKTDDFYTEIICKVSEAGELLWTRMPAPATNGDIYTAVPSPDGNLLLAGDRHIAPAGYFPTLQMIDPNSGSTIWSKIYLEHPMGTLFANAIYSPEGNILHAFDSNDTAFVRQLDPLGNVLWERTFPSENCCNPLVLKRPLTDGFTILTHRNSGAEIYYLRYDYTGNPIFSKTIPFHNIGNLQLLSGTETSEAFVFATNSLDPLIYWLDFEGNLSGPAAPLIDFPVEGSQYWCQGISATADGGFLIVGPNALQPTWFALKTDSAGYAEQSFLAGNVFRDNNLNCFKSPGEPGIKSIEIRATDLDLGLEWFATTSSSGDYYIGVPIGDFEVEALPPGSITGAWEICAAIQNGSIIAGGDTVTIPPIGLKPLVDCPILQLDIAAGLFRPCSTTVVVVTVNNVGTADADSVVVVLNADPALTYQSSTAPLIAQNGNQFWFDAGAVEVLGTTQFSVNFEVSCDAQLNEVLCIGGHVTPDTICESGSTWDGSELKVDVVCDGDSIRFQVSNIGAGNMTEIAELIIIEDYIILLTAPLQLEAGQDTVITLPNPDGQLYYARIPQADGFPGDPYASDGKDFCDGGAPSGMLLQYPLYAGGRADARYCEAVRTAYDPNDKRGFPLGYGAEHFIEPGTALRYMIRFQNTGNDTAFNITVRDTLPLTLDPATLKIGSASHSFEWSLSGQNVLVFKFPNILLPDSSTNEPLSHGFVQFSIEQKKDLPLGTIIENRAAIYFDFNAPVFTEFAWHTLGNSIFTDVETPGALSNVAGLYVSPNPFAEQATISWEHKTQGELTLKIFDSRGGLVLTKSAAGNGGKLELSSERLPAGLYWAELRDGQGRLLGTSKIVKQ